MMLVTALKILQQLKFQNCITLLKVIIFIFHNLEKVPVRRTRFITGRHWPWVAAKQDSNVSL